MVRLPDRRREHDATQMYPERLSQAHVRETVRCGFDPTLGEVWNCDTVEAARYNHTHHGARPTPCTLPHRNHFCFPCVWVCLVRRLQKLGRTPVLLNMANAVHAGGGFWSGAHAQEEDLHRRSDLGEHLEKRVSAGQLRVSDLLRFGCPVMSLACVLSQSGCTHECSLCSGQYPIPDCGAVYSPAVCFFRGESSERFPCFRHPPSL